MYSADSGQSCPLVRGTARSPVGKQYMSKHRETVDLRNEANDRNSNKLELTIKLMNAIVIQKKIYFVGL